MIKNYIEVSLENFLVHETDPIEKVLLKIEQNTYGIIFVLNTNDALIGSVSDGDIRRAIISHGLNALSTKMICNYGVVSVKKTKGFFDLMAADWAIRELKAVPIIDDDQNVVSVLVPKRSKNIKQNADFIIMAGGRGTRLMPLTAETPKPMLMVDGMPMVEHIVKKAAEDGFENIFMSVNYKKEKIIDYFQDGSKWGINIRYIQEEKPLGTAGALSLLKSESPYLLVTNCDVMTELCYSHLLRFARKNDAIATMAVYNLTANIDFGVVQVDGFNITGFSEKPKLSHFINSGVYCLRMDALKHIAQDTFLDMPTLFSCLAKAGYDTYAMPMFESWIDIGRHEDLDKLNS